uniref:Uncharacterized protein n=1 Tax=Romanomermis culicivorax TaxID=13658 RepID=A0A915HHS2_ROMCU
MDDEEKRMMQEMEEGELSDEEESTLANANSKSHHHQAHHHRSRGESQNDSQGSKSSVKEKMLKPENEDSHTKPIKKRKIDEVVENEKPTATENDTSDVESFLKK